MSVVIFTLSIVCAGIAGWYINERLGWLFGIGAFILWVAWGYSL